MSHKHLFLGNNPLKASNGSISGEYIQLDGEDYYKISCYNLMDPFFMTVVSNSDHWMFISSNGALTAGRENASNALFPYYTDDKIHDSQEITGSKSIFHVTRGNDTFVWEPFSLRAEGIYSIQRNIYKNVYGNKLVFEEINETLSLCFRYGWYNSERFGFVKKSTLQNLSADPVEIELLDGIQNILPSGINLGMQTDKSTLLDAYKKNELLTPACIAAFTLSSIPVDRPEPSEALRATLVWSTGLSRSGQLLSSRQLNAFRQGKPVTPEKDIRAARGAFFVHSTIRLDKEQKDDWYLIAELNQDASDLAALAKLILKEQNLIALIDADIQKGTEELVKIVAAADGLQFSADKLSCARHFSNVLFNVMRGGIFLDEYLVYKTDFLDYLKVHNPGVVTAYESFLQSLPEKMHFQYLAELMDQNGNTDLQRLSYEYLPLTFSRRHGDPSRPWNMFSIRIRQKDGSRILDYQGNWRDIFQNWDALCLPFPGFTDSFIAQFVNASTADGYNPYRLTRNGIEWEEHDPHDPWSFIGYWGDHQLIYLLRFLEHSVNHHPGTLQQFMDKEQYVYANVPYRITSYENMVKNPHDTIAYDHDLANTIKQKVQKSGADGKLVWLNDERIYYVNLIEKILVSLLTKLSNFIPEAGIWLNTQRPEWNDANNALVGNGASMVTVYYLRRFLAFLVPLMNHTEHRVFRISAEVSEFLEDITSVFIENRHLLDRHIDDKERRMVCDQLGKAGESYRRKIYSSGFSGKKENITHRQVTDFASLSLTWVDHSIRGNRRSDGLYHAYNLVSFTSDNRIKIRYLYEMLEGQVSVLSSGFLTPEEALHLLDALRASHMYTADRQSYLLYPDRQLKHFDEKNIIPPEIINQSNLLQTLLAAGDDSIVQKDAEGVFHFNPAFRNAKILKETLEKLSSKSYSKQVIEEGEQILSAYEKLFDHQSFTGRSGAFYGYEGLNSIYWHMVSKLVLAVNEIIFQLPPDSSLLESFVAHYYEIRAGIGIHKSPADYGAFPTDPYSHTPGYGGARQPGLTGQVKEDVISRFGELGIQVKKGQIHFDGRLLKKSEFLTLASTFSCIDLEGSSKNIKLPANSLAFTYCKIPVIYHSGKQASVILHLKDGKQETRAGNFLTREESQSIFNREGKIILLEVFL